jgi:hypothetical protein
MKKLLLLLFAGAFELTLLPACEHEREVTTTTTTEERVTHPAAVTTETTRSVAY